jgi:hypothetical protein
MNPLFVIDNDPIVSWPVIVKLPVDGGIYADYQFTAKIRVLSSADFEKLSSETSEVQTMQEILQNNVIQFSKLIVGWDGPTDTNGNPVPFSTEVLAAQITGSRGAELSAGLWNAIREIRTGSRLGNSEPQPVVG